MEKPQPSSGVDPAGLRTAEYIADFVGLPAARIEELANAGYVPHYIFDGQRRFRASEVRTWVKENLVEAHRGMPMPKEITVHKFDQPQAVVAPDCIASICGLRRLPIQVMKFPTAVYFLCRGETVVYVGQAQHVFARVGQHMIAGKDFNHVFYIGVPASELDRIESAFITILKPELNRTKQGHFSLPIGMTKSEAELIVQEFVPEVAIQS